MANEITVYFDDNGVQRWNIPSPILLRLQTLAKWQVTKQEMENEEKLLREMFLRVMKENAIPVLELDGVTISYRGGHTRITIDSKRLKAEQPEIAEKYSKVSNVAESVVITFDD